MKRIGVILFALLFVGVSVFIPCFAEGGYYGIGLNNQNAFSSAYSGLECYLLYSDYDISDLYYFSGTIQLVTSLPVSGVLSFYNSSGSNLELNYYGYVGNDGALHSDVRSVVIYSGSSVDISFDRGNSGDSANYSVIFIDSVRVTSSSFSVYDGTGIIHNISSVFGMIFNSSTILLPLFLIGVTVSLGIVAVRFIRKVMWGN